MVNPEMGSNEVQILCYCTEVDFYGICTLLHYLFSDYFLHLLLTFLHKYLYFLLLTFSNQARYFSFGGSPFDNKSIIS